MDGGHAAERRLQALVGSLRLPVGLEMVPRGEADRGPNSHTEGLPHLRRELGSETTSWGNPYNLKTWEVRRSAVSAAVDSCLDVQDHRSDDPGGRKDCVGSDWLLFRRVTPRQQVRLGVPGSWTERDGEIKPSEELGPPGV